MYTFTSVNNKLMLLGKPVNGELEYQVEFEPIGSMGRYTTDNAELAEKLRKHPEFGKRFMEIGLTAKENPTRVQGIRGSSDKPDLGKEAQDPKKLIRYGVLQATLLKNSGEYRKDASPESITEYEQLKKELEV